MIIPNIWEHIKCSKPPTRIWYQHLRTKNTVILGISSTIISDAIPSPQTRHPPLPCNPGGMYCIWWLLVAPPQWLQSAQFEFRIGHCPYPTCYSSGAPYIWSIDEAFPISASPGASPRFHLFVFGRLVGGFTPDHAAKKSQ